MGLKNDRLKDFAERVRSPVFENPRALTAMISRVITAV